MMENCPRESQEAPESFLCWHLWHLFYCFAPLSAELVIYLLLIVVCMMTGFLDDASKTPWGEYKKGFLDLCVAALVAITF